MRMTVRLLAAGALVAASFGLTSSASACEPHKGGCGGCTISASRYLDGGRLVDCPS